MTKNSLDLDLSLNEDNYIVTRYKNAMELLVDQAIESQIRDDSSLDIASINKIEVAAYALNHLPALYACSEEGLYRQQQRAQQDFKHQIDLAVRQAFRVIGQMPTRFATPLPSEEEELQTAKAALQELVDWLWLSSSDNISWQDLTKITKQILEQMAKTNLEDSDQTSLVE